MSGREILVRGNTYVVNIGVLSLSCVNSGTVGEDNVKANDLVHGKTPAARSVAIATVSEVTTNTNARAGSVRESTLALVVDGLRQVAQPQATTDLGNTLVVKSDILELLEVDDHAAILAARAERCVRVTASLSLKLDVILGGAGDGIGDVLDSGGDDNDSRAVGQVEVVGLSERGEVGIRR